MSKLRSFLTILLPVAKRDGATGGIPLSFFALFYNWFDRHGYATVYYAVVGIVGVMIFSFICVHTKKRYDTLMALESHPRPNPEKKTKGITKKVREVISYDPSCKIVKTGKQELKIERMHITGNNSQILASISNKRVEMKSRVIIKKICGTISSDSSLPPLELWRTNLARVLPDDRILVAKCDGENIHCDYIRTVAIEDIKDVAPNRINISDFDSRVAEFISAMSNQC
mgnify:CR=1 FL=1